MKQKNEQVIDCTIWLVMFLMLVSLFTVMVGASDGTGETQLTGNRNFLWPVPDNYNIMSCYLDPDAITVTHERTGKHYALDISADKNADVIASYDGTVEKVFNGGYGDGFGNYVVIRHDNYKLNTGEKITLYTRYSHLNTVCVQEGSSVLAGDVIGKVGESGFAYGPHLDFQILYQDWNNRQSYGLDPYMNNLLELPSGLYKTASTDCCQNYIDTVKELYKIPLLPEGVTATQLTLSVPYTTQETGASASLFSWFSSASKTTKTTTVSKDVFSRSGPGKEYEKIEKYTSGDRLTAVGYTRNESGNLWYYTENGTYIYSGNVDITSCLSTARITNVDAPNKNINQGSVYVLKGSISSSGNELLHITATVKDASGNIVLTKTDTVDGTYSIQNSPLDEAMTFNALAKGDYQYEISVEESVDTGVQCRTITTILYTSKFSVV